MLVVEGYRFSMCSVPNTKNRIRWQCSLKTRTKCRASMVTLHDNIVKANLEHNH